VPLLLSIIAVVHFVVSEPMLSPIDSAITRSIGLSGQVRNARKAKARYMDPSGIGHARPFSMRNRARHEANGRAEA